MPGFPLPNPRQQAAAKAPLLIDGPGGKKVGQTANKTTATASSGNAAADHIRNMQQFLKNRGYSIAVDGIRGPQTNAVVAAFHNRVTPDQLRNKGKATTVSPSISPGTFNSKNTGNSNFTGGAIDRVPTKKTPKTSTPASTSSPSDASGNVDPYAFATASANAEYDPQIAALKAQFDALTPQHKQNSADLTSWYKQLSGLVGGQAQQQGIDSAAQLAEYDKAANNSVGQLFGGGGANPAAGEAMAYHDIGRTALQGEDSAQAAFLRNMAPILGAQGVDAQRAELGSFNKNSAALQGQLGAMRGAKGNAYTQALAQGQQQLTQQQTAQQSLKLAQQLMPYQVQTAKAQAASAKADASNATALAKANLDLVNAKVQQAQAAALGTKGGWNLQDPGDRGSLAQALRTSIGNQQGYLRVNPKIALDNISQALAQAGLSGDSDAQSIAQAVFAEILNNSHSAKLWRNVTYADGKLTVKPKAKTKK